MDSDHLKKKGKLVLVGGTFDLIHPGHIFFLDNAKKLGDVLIVIVARDTTVRKLKRAPIIPENQRVDVVSALKPVDFAILGKEKEDFTEIVKEIKPDIIVLGPNQIHDISELKEKLQKSGLKAEVIKLDKFKKNTLCSTKQIIKKIKESKTQNPNFFSKK